MKKRNILYAGFLACFVLYMLFSTQLVSLFLSDCFRKTSSNILEDHSDLFYGVDILDNQEDSFWEEIHFRGWMLCDTELDNSEKQLGIVLSNENTVYSYLSSFNMERPDVTKNHSGAMGNSHGGDFYPSTILVKDGTYRVGFYCWENDSAYGYAQSPFYLTKRGRSVTIETWHSQPVTLNTAGQVLSDGKAHVDLVTDNGEAGVTIAGWAILPEKDPKEHTAYVMLTYEDGTVQVFDTALQNRPDLASLGSEKYSTGGFRAEIPAGLLHGEDYRVSVLVQDPAGIHTSPEMLESVQTGLLGDTEADRGGLVLPDRGGMLVADSGDAGFFAAPMRTLLSLCYRFLFTYPLALAIVLFTLLTKVILLPVTLWTHRNSIKMVELMPALNRAKVKYYGDKDAIAEETQRLYREYHYHPLLSTIPMILQIVLLMGVVDAVKALLGPSKSALTLVPAADGGWTWIMPLLAGLAAAALSLAQSRFNPLQREQTPREQLMTGGVSVAISLFLGAYVMVGVAIYWIFGNLFSILQQLLVNQIIKPEDHVDYPALNESKKELAAIESLAAKVSPEDKKREKEDYKRFFSVANKHLVFYSEKSGFYKYFQNVIEYLLSHSNIIIHYVTSDPQDKIFDLAKEQPQIRPYYIGERRLITLFMKMDADIVCMTTPDLNNLYLKRSYVRKDIQYIYLFHGLASTNMVVRKGAYDGFDTIFCVGQHQVNELRETEEMYSLPAKNLVPCGYGLLDNLIRDYNAGKGQKKTGGKRQILIAPSWQEGNILDSCIVPLVEQLQSEENFVVIRPHPEYIKRFPGKMEQLVARYRDVDKDKLVIESDFSSNVTIFTADLLITDWSGIAYEFSFTTQRPSLFINTPMKVLNPDYAKYRNKPTDITFRDMVGVSVDPDRMDRVRELTEELFAHREAYGEKIRKLTQETIFNIGRSGEVGGRYIVEQFLK